MIREFWPELFEMGVICYFQTPIVRVFLKKEVLNFFSEHEFRDWCAKNDGKVTYKSKYYKGLGTSKSEDFQGYLDNINAHLIAITCDGVDDINALDLAFNHARADDRKSWLALRDVEMSE